MNTDSSNRTVWTPASPEDNSLVSAALEEILASTPFRGSRRYPAMLRYVVEKTLAHQDSSLKERTIGVEVFGRDPSYDTSADPVVRFSAGEIRRRLAQFYRENETTNPVVLELPSGSYVPRLYRRSETLAEPAVHEVFLPHAEVEAEPPRQTPPAPMPPVEEHRPGTRWKFLMVAALVLIAIGGWLIVRARQKPHDPVLEVWSPLLKIDDPVLISAGRPLPETGDSPESPNISIGDHILRPEFRVSIATLDAIANIVGYLKTFQKPFRIHEANSNTLADLHDRPVVLVTGNNNKWTKVLLKPLRFQFVQEGQFSYIQDARNPQFRGWSVDFSKPFHQQTTDYAIVGGFNSSTTGGPVIVIAGISSNGTEAAGEFMVSPEALAGLEKLAPPGRLSHNFEAVLKVEVVDGNTGAASIVASEFW